MKNSTTYVIGRCDGLAPQLRALTKWIAEDAFKREAEARVVFLDGVVYEVHTKVIFEEVCPVLQAFPGSTIIRSRRDQGLLDFLEGDWNRAPTMSWMAHGGRAVVEAFGVGPEMRRSRDIRRLLKRVSPHLLNVLRAAKEFEIEGNFCFIEGWSFPNPANTDANGADPSYWCDDNITTWHKAVQRIVVHERMPTNDFYPEFSDWEVALGGFPAQTGRVHLLAIDNGKAARFAFASLGNGGETITVRPAEAFLEGARVAVRIA